MEYRAVPNKNWVEAVYTTVYLLNKCLPKAMQEATPKEAWLGRTPQVSPLKVFGSFAYVLFSEEKRTKPDAAKCRTLTFIE
jgi:hypothetical protein